MEISLKYCNYNSHHLESAISTPDYELWWNTV